MEGTTEGKPSRANGWDGTRMVKETDLGTVNDEVSDPNDVCVYSVEPGRVYPRTTTTSVGQTLLSSDLLSLDLKLSPSLLLH